MDKVDEIVTELNLLLTRNYDAEKGFTEAAENIRNPVLKDFFQGSARQRYDFGHRLKDEIAKLGGKPEKGTSLKGDLHRGWMNLKAVISSNDASIILEECERGEAASLKDYQEVLNKHELTGTSLKVVKQQEETIHQNRKHVHNLLMNFKL